MSRRKPPAPAHCPLTCLTCLRSCKAAQPFNHRFDCCGQIEAHVHTRTARRRVTNPIQVGYLTGPAKTRRQA